MASQSASLCLDCNSCTTPRDQHRMCYIAQCCKLTPRLNIHTTDCIAAVDEAGKQVATEVAVGLVAAYAELRQLQFLLQSLLDSLAAQQPLTASTIICSTRFSTTLHQVQPCITLCWLPGNVQIALLYHVQIQEVALLRKPILVSLINL